MTNCIVRDGVILRLYGEVYPLPMRHGHEPEPVAVAVVAATPVEEVSAASRVAVVGGERAEKS